jgi:hypothetical protein
MSIKVFFPPLFFYSRLIYSNLGLILVGGPPLFMHSKANVNVLLSSHTLWCITEKERDRCPFFFLKKVLIHVNQIDISSSSSPGGCCWKKKEAFVKRGETVCTRLTWCLFFPNTHSFSKVGNKGWHEPNLQAERDHSPFGWLQKPGRSSNRWAHVFAWILL